MMIDNFFTSDGPAVQADLDRIHALVGSETFLQRLGMNAHEAPSSVVFPVVTDIARASELMLPHELHELPEPWPYQDFYGAVEAATQPFDSSAARRRRCWRTSPTTPASIR